MNVEEIRKHIRRSPFRPFRVFVSDGSHYDIPHPDFILISKTNVEIGIGKNPEEVPDRTVSCDPLHVTRIEPIRSGGRSNGRASKS